MRLEITSQHPAQGPAQRRTYCLSDEVMKVQPEEMRCPEAKLRLLVRISLYGGCEIKGPRIVETPSCF